MAESVVKAQNFIVCQLCETENKIKWKCVECELLMCNKCKEKIHPKFKNAKDHRIIDIKDVGIQDGGSGDNLDFTNIKCKQHQGQACCLFCSYCNTLVCPSCVAKTHTGHTFIELNDAYNMKLDKLKKGQKKVEKDNVNITREEKELNQVKNIQDSKYNKAMEDLQTQKNALIKDVNAYVDKLSNDLNKKIKSIHDSIDTEKKKVVKSRGILEEQKNKVKDVISTTDMSRLFDEADKLGKSMEEVIPPVSLNHGNMVKFVPGEITQSNIGSLQADDGAGMLNNTKMRLKMKKVFETEMKYLQFVCVCQDNSMWIGDDTSKVLQKVKPIGNKLKPTSTFNTAIRGIVLTQSNDLIFSNSGPTLKQVSDKTGQLTDSKYSVAPLCIMSVHMLDNDTVIVGAMTNEPIWPVKGRRPLIVMDNTGRHQNTYEYESNGKRIFTYPALITSTRNGNICVSDWLNSDRRSRLVVLKQDGNILNTYLGHPKFNVEDKPFKPRDIVTSPSDYIIISESSSNLIHMLDSSGCFVAYFDTADIGVIFPYALSFSGKLYVGCSTLQQSQDNAKLYEVEY